MERLLPRHMEIIYEINDRFLDELREAYPGDELRIRRMSIIQEHPDRSVRMAYLATVAGNKVNGVAELQSQLLREKVLRDFAEVYPDKFTNVTNGVTPAPVHEAGQPASVRPDHREHRGRLGQRPDPAGPTGAAGRRRRVPRSVRRR